MCQNKRYYLIILLLSITFSQSNFNLSYESKYGNGTSVNEQYDTEEFYHYFENLLDLNYSYQNIFIYSQLEYSNPTIYGFERKGINNLANSYFVEYSGDNLMLKYGYLRTLYGYGLTINMFQDQAIDFDNRVKGWEVRYSPSQMMDVFYVTGKGNYGLKSSGDLRGNDLLFEHSLNLYGAQVYTSLGDFMLIASDKSILFKSEALWGDSPGQVAGGISTFENHLGIALNDLQWTWDFSESDSLYALDQEVDMQTFNLAYSNTLGNTDIYIENEWNTYNIIHGENIDGHRTFVSLATELFGMGIIYEYKDYNMLYYLPITSNPPIAFKEPTSVLMSRKRHAIDFSDELGHQIDVNFNLYDVSLSMNMSIGRKHEARNWNDIDFDDNWNIIYGQHDEPSFEELINMDFEDEALRNHNPFRELYVEASGWNNFNTFFYKIGYSKFDSYDVTNSKHYDTYTIPTQFVYELSNGDAMTFYIEYQNTRSLTEPGFMSDEIEYDIYDDYYTSYSYHIKDLMSLTYFYDKEVIQHPFTEDSSNSENSWEGYEVSFELSSSMHLSIFKGSQKGGLVCANGICAVQPAFENGLKITLRALF